MIWINKDYIKPSEYPLGIIPNGAKPFSCMDEDSGCVVKGIFFPNSEEIHIQNYIFQDNPN